MRTSAGKQACKDSNKLSYYYPLPSLQASYHTLVLLTLMVNKSCQTKLLHSPAAELMTTTSLYVEMACRLMSQCNPACQDHDKQSVEGNGTGYQFMSTSSFGNHHFKFDDVGRMNHIINL